MKKSITLFVSVVASVAFCAAVWAAVQNQKPEEPAILPSSAYRVPLEEIIVEGREPYWHHKAPPRWDKPKVVVPKPDAKTAGRLQWAPRYTRDEREDYNHVRDQMEPKARFKLFEIRF